MPVVPGVPGAGLPGGNDALVRRVQELERVQREVLPAVMAVVGPAISDVQTQQATLTSQQAALTSQQAQLTSTVNDLAARVSSTVTIPTFNSGTLPNDSLYHPYGTPFSITLAVPTGRLIVAVGCSQATMNPGSAGGAVEADASFSINDGSGVTYWASGYTNSTAGMIGVALITERSVSLPAGTYTVTAQMQAWAAGTTGASVNFQTPFLTVTVTG